MYIAASQILHLSNLTNFQNPLETGKSFTTLDFARFVKKIYLVRGVVGPIFLGGPRAVFSDKLNWKKNFPDIFIYLPTNLPPPVDNFFGKKICFRSTFSELALGARI
jgi:hypothetical protein